MDNKAKLGRVEMDVSHAIEASVRRGRDTDKPNPGDDEIRKYRRKRKIRNRMAAMSRRGNGR